MRALWLEEQALSLREIEQPEPPPGEALVRVLRAGVCNTDLELLRGYYPYRGVLGHEFVGEVVVGSERFLGVRVVGEINAVCERCAACLAGRQSHCEHRTVLGIVNRDGAFADYLSLPEVNLHPVPDGLSLEAATFVEPLAAAFQVTEQVSTAPHHKVLIVGDGKLGQMIARVQLLSEGEVCVLGHHQSKLEMLEALGARIATAPTDLPDTLRGRFDLAIECTGNPEGFALALSELRPRGTLVMKSTYVGQLTFDAARVVVDEINLVGSRCGPFAPALEALASGQIDPSNLIDAVYPLSDAIEAFDHAGRPGALKILLNAE